ncbi:MAG: hypothetical protein J5977_10775 [Fibrobacter sp.]|nr:hypothetical protein [Fibrobacter sp.]
MKKIILILSILALNAFAINCRNMLQAFFASNATNTYLADSAYIENYGSDFTYYASMKYHYTGNNLDSIVRCVEENCSTILQKTVQEKSEENIKTTTYYNDQIIQEETYLIGKDSSLAYVYSPAISDEPEIDYMRISYLRHDTLYREVWDLSKSTLQKEQSSFITPDANDENTCIITSYDSPSSTTHQIITNTENGFVVSNRISEEKMFYILVNPNSTTSVKRKIRPTIIPEKAKHFDLLGRPIKNKSEYIHTPQVTK